MLKRNDNMNLTIVEFKVTFQAQQVQLQNI